MSKVALITDVQSLDIDFDMSLIMDACHKLEINAEVVAWNDINIDWAQYDAIVLRSPWDCIHTMPEFIKWCETVGRVSRLFNPLSIIKWNLDKHYLSDLAELGVGVVPSIFVNLGSDPLVMLHKFLQIHPETSEIVIKPTVGSYSRGVKRFNRSQVSEITQYIATLLGQDREVIIQPYFSSIDTDGETNITFFDGVYSHAIRKGALLSENDIVNPPLQDFREVRTASTDEKVVAVSALKAATSHLKLDDPLLYARVDLIRNKYGYPLVLELEIFEPSLNLPFKEDSSLQFAGAIKQRLTPAIENV